MISILLLLISAKTIEMPDKSLNCNFINCLLTDNENIWVGTEIGGINLLTPKLSANVCVAI